MIQAGLYPNPVVGYSGSQINDGPGTSGQQGGYVAQEVVTGGKLRVAAGRRRSWRIIGGSTSDHEVVRSVRASALGLRRGNDGACGSRGKHEDRRGVFRRGGQSRGIGQRGDRIAVRSLTLASGAIASQIPGNGRTATHRNSRSPTRGGRRREPTAPPLAETPLQIEATHDEFGAMTSAAENAAIVQDAIAAGRSGSLRVAIG